MDYVTFGYSPGGWSGSETNQLDGCIVAHPTALNGISMAALVCKLIT